MKLNGIPVNKQDFLRMVMDNERFEIESETGIRYRIEGKPPLFYVSVLESVGEMEEAEFWACGYRLAFTEDGTTVATPAILAGGEEDWLIYSLIPNKRGEKGWETEHRVTEIRRAASDLVPLYTLWIDGDSSMKKLTTLFELLNTALSYVDEEGVSSWFFLNSRQVRLYQQLSDPSLVMKVEEKELFEGLIPYRQRFWLQEKQHLLEFMQNKGENYES